MRILHIVHQYPPDHVAGTELYTQSVATRQAEVGHAVTVFAPLNRAGRFSPEPTTEAGVRVYRAPAGERGPSAVFRSTFRHPALAAAFASVLAREKPNVVHLQHLIGLPAAVGGQLREAAIPYVISLHDYWYGCANGQLLTNDTEKICAGPDGRFHNCGRCAVARAGFVSAAGVLGPLPAPLLRRRDVLLRPIFSGAACVMAPNAFVSETYAAMGFPSERVIVIPLGLDAPPNLDERVAARRAARAKGSLRLGYVGSISRQKGLHVLIDAVNLLPEEGVTLDVYGDTSVFPAYSAELVSLARHPGIRFNGPVSRDRVWDALADLDVLIFPTLWYEASPAIIREAFAVGLPVVASNLGAAGRMIRDSVDGLLSPPGNAAALGDTLLGLLQRPERIAKLRAGIAPVRSVAEHLAEIEQVYRAVLAA